MNDAEIRPVLLKTLREKDPHVVIFEEFPLCRGLGRADVAAVNGAMCGYEIKGSGDSTRRLPKQVGDYERVFDFCAVVVTPNHLKSIRKIIPQRWGIAVVCDADTEPTIKQIRQAKRNSHTDATAIMRLLWRREAARALKKYGVSISPQALISQIWDTMTESMTHDIIAAEVRTALKARVGS